MNFKLLLSTLVLAGLAAGPASAQYLGGGYSYGPRPNGTYGYGPPLGIGTGYGFATPSYFGATPFGYGYISPLPGAWQYWQNGGLSPGDLMNRFSGPPTVPTIGVNVPAAPLPGVGSAPAPTQKIAGLRQETSDAEQAGVTLAMEDVMSKHPLCQGTVLKVGATGVQARYEVNGHVHITRFQPGQVFFFKSDGRLGIASRDASTLHEGDHVLIPEPSWSR